MLGNIFAPLGMKIAGGIAAALAIALAVVMWRANAISNDREAIRNALATETARHAVTRQSVETLQGELAKLVREGDIRRERVVEAMKRVEKDTKPLRDTAERIERDGLPDDYTGMLKDAGL